MRIKCLAQEHNTMSPARARTQTARSGVERTSHEATAPAHGLLVYTIKKLSNTCGKTVLGKFDAAFPPR